MELRRKAALLDAVYAELPTVACKGECHESCGPLLMTQTEQMRLRSAPKTPHDNPLTCPVLSREKRCKAYERRPLVCRLFGVVDDPKMRCPFGCEPSRYLSNAEVGVFMRRVEEISVHG